jgi:hypothetical protein
MSKSDINPFFFGDATLEIYRLLNHTYKDFCSSEFHDQILERLNQLNAKQISQRNCQMETSKISNLIERNRFIIIPV